MKVRPLVFDEDRRSPCSFGEFFPSLGFLSEEDSIPMVTACLCDHGTYEDPEELDTVFVEDYESVCQAAFERKVHRVIEDAYGEGVITVYGHKVLGTMNFLRENSALFPDRREYQRVMANLEDMLDIKHVGEQPAFEVGQLVDYHSIIDGPVTLPGVRITAGPELLGGHTWCCWIEKKAGCVSCDALTLAEGDSDGR